MSIISKLKKAGEKIMDKAQGIDPKLKEWQDKFETAKKDYDLSQFDDREKLYMGTHEVDKNINSQISPKKKANNVINIIYEFIETMVDSTIPQPSIKSKIKGFDFLSQMIEDSLKSDLMEMGIEQINDEGERTTMVQGFSVVMVNWDRSFKHHMYRGRIELTSFHPKQIIPQPRVYDLQKMDYFFILVNTTKQKIKKEYNVDLKNESDEYPEITSLDGGNNPTGETVTKIIAMYRDDDGDIGKFVWVNDTILEDKEKYFYRRLQRCTKCNAPKIEEECICGNKKYSESIEEYETLEDDILLKDGTVIPQGTKVPYFIPNKYPVIIRKNVPVQFKFGAQSDVDVIRDQQDAIKKTVTSMEEKIIRGGYIILADEEHRFELTNELYQVIRGTPQQLSSLNVRDLTADIQKEMQFVQQQYKAAQSTLGITDSFQGKPDTTARSGIAKQIQVQQSTGRIQSKLFNKYAFYKELFEMIFSYKLAFYDELRPYVKRGQNGDNVYGDFNRYEFLVRDEAGEWFYNTDFLFSSDAGNGIPSDKMWLQYRMQELFQLGAVDKVQLWTIYETLKFPMATEIKAQAITEKQMAQAMQGQPGLTPGSQPGSQPIPAPGDMSQTLPLNQGFEPQLDQFSQVPEQNTNI